MSQKISKVLLSLFPKSDVLQFTTELLKELKEHEGLEYENSWCETFGPKRKFNDDYSTHVILGIFDNNLLPNRHKVGTIKISSLLNLYSIERINQM